MRKVLVTGAAQGLGFCFVQECLNRGFAVLATTRQNEFGKPLRGLQETFPNQLFLKTMDITKEQDCQSVKEWVQAQWSELDLLINNAAISWPQPEKDVASLSTDEVLSVFSVNVIGAARATKSFLPLLFKSENPQVLFISSRLGLFSENDKGRGYSYRMSKSALNMFALNLQIEFPQLDVRLVSPGHVRTRMVGFQAPYAPEDSVVKILDHLVEKKKASFHLFNAFTNEVFLQS